MLVAHHLLCSDSDMKIFCLKGVVHINGPKLFLSLLALRELADASIDISSCYADLTPFRAGIS